MFESEAFREVWAPRLLSLVRVLLGLIYLEHGVSKYLGFQRRNRRIFTPCRCSAWQASSR
jgi:uncharacterized membrane protein YphA (DoxX/SURF4 family)